MSTINRSDLTAAELRANIAERLRGACRHMSQAEFEGLVARIAVLEMKYDTERQVRARRGTHPAHPSTPEAS